MEAGFLMCQRDVCPLDERTCHRKLRARRVSSDLRPWRLQVQPVPDLVALTAAPRNHAFLCKS